MNDGGGINKLRGHTTNNIAFEKFLANRGGPKELAIIRGPLGLCFYPIDKASKIAIP